MIDSNDIKDIIADIVIGFDVVNLKNNQNFFDAGMDSLDHMNVLLAIEEKYDYIIPNEDVDQCLTIDGIIACLQSQNG